MRWILKFALLALNQLFTFWLGYRSVWSLVLLFLFLFFFDLNVTATIGYNLAFLTVFLALLHFLLFFILMLIHFVLWFLLQNLTSNLVIHSNVGVYLCQEIRVRVKHEFWGACRLFLLVFARLLQSLIWRSRLKFRNFFRHAILIWLWLLYCWKLWLPDRLALAYYRRLSMCLVGYLKMLNFRRRLYVARHNRRWPEH